MVDVTFGVLGPVCIRVGGRPAAWPRGKTGAVLASLLLHVNTTVSRDRLIASLWDAPPSSAVANVQSYITQLRRMLPADARLLTRGSGYALEAPPEQVDLLVFDAEFQVARSEAGRDEAEAATQRLQRALTLWRGRPAEGSPLRGDMLARVGEVQEWHTQARLELAALKLSLGRPHDTLSDLRRLLAEQPRRERVWYLLMRALVLCGRPDEAIEAYRQACDALADGAGTEPGQDLRRLRAELLGRETDAGTPQRQSPPVCLLPPDIVDFVGRREELATAIGTLRRHQAQSTPDAALDGPMVPVCVVSGQGGVGKTALAVHLAHRLRRDFPDGQLHVNLRGEGNHPADPEEVLGRLLRALGADPAALPAGLAQREELYRGILANGRYLVVLDDAHDEGQVRPLLPGTSGCAVLVTSRRRLTGLPAARVIDLPTMPPQEAVDLLRNIIGAERAAREPQNAARLVRLCDCLPLAVRIAGAKLAARPHWHLDQLVSRLNDSSGPLSRLSHGSQAVRASLAVGYQGLRPEAQRLFRLLGLLEAPDFATWPAAALLGMPYAEAEDLMEELADIRLLEVAGRDPTGQTRYRLHDLTRAYARECGEQRDGEDERAAALRRVLSAWLTLTRQAHVRLCGGDYRLPRPTSPSWAAAVDVAGRHVLPDPLGWADAERAGIVAAVRQCAALGAHEIGWELAAAGLHLFETRGHYDEWRITHEIALPAARAAGDVRGQAHMLNGLGRLFFARNDTRACEQSLKEALELFEQAADRHGHALTLANMAEFHRLRNRHDQALACYERALVGLAEAGDRGTEISVLRGLGRMYFSQGRLEHATSYTRRAMRLAHDIGDVRAREFTRIVLGEIELARGDLPAAEMCFTQAMDGLGTLGFPMGIAYARLGLATARLARHDLTDADHLLGQALAAYRDAFDTVGQARVLLASAEVRRRQRRFGEAIAMLTDAADTYQAIASPYRYGVALRALAEVHREAGDLSSAIETWERCLKTLTALDAPEANEVAALLRRHAPGRYTGDRTVTAAGSGSAEAFRAS
ncbi:AfsR/SARP family transcriptional regulator [Streptosporangium pseudovulgare]|uniref:SARP family transcriptional regulator n=1 Tax=Streptosporangium pseudovulgare TaxID=35765 RepID=A0ABQ2RM01_9ACTN|nr:BTAD domain-containing putative transcriptional regulator [Streptosporangium pseudovulgare]GGQ34864.1 SARP family transcriptional regulator [Streptosporangium pseudovulgare]